VLSRKNQATLSDDEKTRFVAAVLALKANGKYDQYVREHRDSMQPAEHWAHRGPAFFPWHREFLRRFELDLQSVDSSVTLPYWDWSVDQAPPSWPFTEEFLGRNGTSDERFPGKVVDGPFAFDGPNRWTLNVVPAPPENTANYLRRELGTHAGSLPTPAAVTDALCKTPYDVAPWHETSPSGFRNRLEGWIPANGPWLHNRVHEWVGGSMRPATSPNDPVFFLNHCFVDKLWVDWQVQHPGEGYLPSSGAHAGHNLNDLMKPWNNVRPANVLDHHALGYRYDTEDIHNISGALSLLLEQDEDISDALSALLE
jgi:tyrosinase